MAYPGKTASTVLTTAALLLAAHPVHAKCAINLCLCYQATSVLDGTIAAVGDAGTEVDVMAAYGEVLDGGSPTRLTVDTRFDDVVGRRTLVLQSNGSPVTHLVANEQQEIVCPSADQGFRLAVDEAIGVALSPTCAFDLQERGYRNPPCREGPLGCSGIAEPLSSPALSVLALAFLWSSRSRRRSPQG